MPKRTTRRRFIKTSAAIGAGFFVAAGVTPRESRAANEQIQFGCIGIGGKGDSDSADAGRGGAVVAICDIDDQRLDRAAARFGKAKKYNDYRKMLEENKMELDAVTVSTPDHNHAPASVMAMNMGLHCFCQKPLTHSIYEARLMGEIAREKGLATQMGNQGTAHPTLRKSVALIQAGAIGVAKEVHVWTNRPVWPQGLDRPPGEPVPEHVHWPEWIGPAKMRPYNRAYHPFKWRGFWDFGTGALGDMACHTLNMAYMALNLRNPTSVQAETSGHNKETYPAWSVIKFVFPQIDKRPALTMTWYDGGKRPPSELVGGRPMKSSGALVVGDKGSFYSPGDYGGDNGDTGIIYPDGEFVQQDAIKEPAVEFERSPGHFDEFVNAIKSDNKEPARSNFPDYAGPLTETILLGNLAVWADGATIDWDAEKLIVKNGNDELKEIVKHTYHNGYKL